MHRIDLVTGGVAPDTANPGDVTRWLVDSDFRIRGAVATVQADGSKVGPARPGPARRAPFDPWAGARDRTLWTGARPLMFDQYR